MVKNVLIPVEKKIYKKFHYLRANFQTKVLRKLLRQNINTVRRTEGEKTRKGK